MRILLFGKDGQIGWELQRTLAPLGEVLAVDRPEVDFMDLEGLRKFTLEAKPDLIVNAAAYTDVDKAESEPGIAMRVNGEAPGVLAEVAKHLDIGLVHYSTDYVFDGAKGKPYTEEDEPNPINVYGQTKLAGDRAIQGSGCLHLILRTSWVYGARGTNFFLTILRLAKEGKEIRVVDDQIGSPTWCRSIAEATASVLRRLGATAPDGSWMDQGGLYNCSAGGEVSWFEFARAILKGKQARRGAHRASPDLQPIGTQAYGAKAPRPRYSVLDGSKLERAFDVKLASWQAQLGDCWGSMERLQAGSVKC
jgi:dTDP-4-dehydrorhamnose reductase